MVQQKSACLASMNNNTCFEFSPQNPVSKSEVPGAYLYPPPRAREVDTWGSLASWPGLMSRLQLSVKYPQNWGSRCYWGMKLKVVLFSSHWCLWKHRYQSTPVHPSKGERQEEEGLGCRQSFKGHIRSDHRWGGLDWVQISAVLAVYVTCATLCFRNHTSCIG